MGACPRLCRGVSARVIGRMRVACARADMRRSLARHDAVRRVTVDLQYFLFKRLEKVFGFKKEYWQLKRNSFADSNWTYLCIILFLNRPITYILFLNIDLCFS